MAKLLGCAVYDNVTSQFYCFQFVNSKAEYLRTNVESFIMGLKNLNDLTPFILCSYDSESGEIVPCKESFKFDEYQMPLSKADALAPLGAQFSKDALEYAEYKKNKSNGGN